MRHDKKEDREVLNAQESDAYTHAKFLQARGVNRADAAYRALELMEDKRTKRFAEWLSGGKVSYVDGQVVWVDGEASDTSADDTVAEDAKAKANA